MIQFWYESSLVQNVTNDSAFKKLSYTFINFEDKKLYARDLDSDNSKRETYLY